MLPTHPRILYNSAESINPKQMIIGGTSMDGVCACAFVCVYVHTKHFSIRFCQDTLAPTLASPPLAPTLASPSLASKHASCAPPTDSLSPGHDPHEHILHVCHHRCCPTFPTTKRRASPPTTRTICRRSTTTGRAGAFVHRIATLLVDGVVAPSEPSSLYLCPRECFFRLCISSLLVLGSPRTHCHDLVCTQEQALHPHAS